MITTPQNTPRLNRQLDEVRKLMLDRKPRTLREIVDALAESGVNASEASVSARVRDLRKLQYGGFTVARTHLSNGLHTYRVV